MVYEMEFVLTQPDFKKNQSVTAYVLKFLCMQYMHVYTSVYSDARGSVCEHQKSTPGVFLYLSLIIFKTRVCHLPYSWTIGVG